MGLAYANTTGHKRDEYVWGIVLLLWRREFRGVSLTKARVLHHLVPLCFLLVSRPSVQVAHFR